MSKLSDVAVDAKVKLGALWIAATFCSIYSTLVRLYVPGAVERMNTVGASLSQASWMWIALPILVPITMIFLSVALPATFNRILNIVVGLLLIILLGFGRMMNSMLASLPDRTTTVPFPAREAAVALETAMAILAALVVWYAWNWPRKPNAV
jgi:hypothetical protein